MTVLEFPGPRRPATPDHLQCRKCGNEWFELRRLQDGELVAGAVVLNTAGSIVGYAGLPHCLTCGQQNIP